jgi:hypothetical protein
MKSIIMNSKVLSIALTLGLLVFAKSTLAHHSFSAIWDEGAEFEITGTFSKVRWMNPHSWFEIEVQENDGSTQTFSFENFPPAMLNRMGMSKKLMTEQIGKTVTITYNPAYDHSEPVGYGRIFEFVDGPKILFTSSSQGGREPGVGRGIVPASE